MSYTYKEFLSTSSRKQWERIGLNRRAGVAVPLFSVYSQNSIGIGEWTDLIFLIDWCRLAGMSIIQLLPMNDTGSDFRPYDAQSTFALEPVYLAIPGLKAVDLNPFKKKISGLREAFPTGAGKVNYKIKEAKLSLLWEIFRSGTFVRSSEYPAYFERYVEENKFWLDDYAIFKVIKEKSQEKGWEFWHNSLSERSFDALKVFARENAERIIFHKWLQWQLYEQFKVIKKYAESRKVLLMGDLPFLVARDSADVWAHQDYFKLDFCSGAPPDMYFAHGQRWGMPVYNWENIAKNNYDYLKEKLKYAQNFYDLFRIDHAVGIFRVWSIPLSEPPETDGLNGTFDPVDERLWEEHGRKILSVMVENTAMLPCAEDLGVVPLCSYKVLAELGIPGIEVQRWSKYWENSYDFKAAGDYRKNSVSTVSTHDSSFLCAWWKFEAGTADEQMFKRKCREKGISFDAIMDKLFDLNNSFYGRLRWKESVRDTAVLLKALSLAEDQAGDFISIYRESFGEKEKFLKYLEGSDSSSLSEISRKAFEKASASASIFSVQLLPDILSVDCWNECDLWDFRVNTPGTVSDKNWSLVMPLSLEDILALPMNNVIKNINTNTLRS